MKGKRLDQRLFELGLAESREKAKATIMSGLVYVNGQKSDKPGTPVSDEAKIEVRGSACPYVSRGGFKLAKALEVFPIAPEGKVCIDCGASTGGFTDVLLKNGASRVYAVDVGYGQLAWPLRQDGRVVVMERTNARSLTPDMFPESMDLAVMDLSFLSGARPAEGGRRRGLPHQAAVRGGQGRCGQEGRGARPGGARARAQRDGCLFPHGGIHAHGARLLAHTRAGREHRVPGLAQEGRSRRHSAGHCGHSRRITRGA